MRRRGGWRGNVSCGRRKRIVSTRCLNSASRFWSSTWTWAGQVTHQITGETTLTRRNSPANMCRDFKPTFIFHRTCWQCLFTHDLALAELPMLSDRDVQFLGLYVTKTRMHASSENYFWGVMLFVSASLIGTVVPVF